MKKEENYIDLKNIPLKKHGKKYNYAWNKCEETPAKFKYKNTEGILYITYKGKTKRGNKNISVLNVKCDGYEQDMVSSLIINCKLGGLLKYKTSDHHYKIGEEVNGSIVINKIKMKNKSGDVKGYEMLCLETKGKFEMREGNLKAGQKSPYLRGYKIGPGNSLFNEKHVLKHLKNINDAHVHHKKSGKKIKVECKNCGFEKDIMITDLVKYGFSCPFCTKGISFPERFMGALLKINNVKYEFQKTFPDLERKRFDFYLPLQNCVIEMNGVQHYKQNDYLNHEATVLSDKIKKDYCVDKNIEYIPINCSLSTFEFVIDNIKKSTISEIFKNMNKEDVSNKIIEMFVVENINGIVADYKSGMTYTNIVGKYGLKDKHELVGILKKYGIYEFRDGVERNEKSVTCLNNDKTFKNVKEAMQYAGLKSSSHIVQVCRGKRKTSGKHPETGEPLKWMYYQDYINQQEML